MCEFETLSSFSSRPLPFTLCFIIQNKTNPLFKNSSGPKTQGLRIPNPKWNTPLRSTAVEAHLSVYLDTVITLRADRGHWGSCWRGEIGSKHRSECPKFNIKMRKAEAINPPQGTMPETMAANCNNYNNKKEGRNSPNSTKSKVLTDVAQELARYCSRPNQRANSFVVVTARAICIILGQKN